MKIQIFTFLSIAALACIPAAGFAQGAPKDTARIPKSWWVDLGFGKSTLESGTFALAGNIEVANKWLITPRILYETNGMVHDTYHYTGPDISIVIHSTQILVGKIFNQRHSLFAISAGLSWTNVDIVNYSQLTFSTTYQPCFFCVPPITGGEKNEDIIGFPVLVQGYLIALQGIGVGFSGFVDLNFTKTTAGVSLNFGLGHMNTRR